MSTKQHVPERTCIACRQIKPKLELVRLVHTPNGAIEVDQRGKEAGRGAYLCRTRECWELALTKDRKKRLVHALKTEIAPEDRVVLTEYGKALPAAA